MNIKELIPQRHPFLFVDEIIELDKEHIQTQITFKEDLDFFKGHFPGMPIVPGVILTEHCFQSGAALISSKGGDNDLIKNLAVVSRIQSAKYKNMVKPNETIKTNTTLKEMMGTTAFFKSISTNEQGKKVLILEFACTMVPA